MLQVLISMFGIVIVYRNLSLLEKLNLLTQQKMFLFFVILQFPFFLLILFKDQILFTLTYIGIFSITLIFYRGFFCKFAKMTYVKCHLRLLDQLILLLKTGKSAQLSLKIVMNSLTDWQKLVFSDLENLFSVQNSEKKSVFQIEKMFFLELKNILTANHKIIDQLISYRSALKIQYDLRHKSRQVTQQIRAQAVIAIFIYILIFSMSLKYLQLQIISFIFLTSVSLFIIGFACIFVIGGRLKWKT